MHQASAEQYRKIVAAVVAAAARLPKPAARRRCASASCRAYYANVDAEDIAARDPRTLAGAALSHLAVRAAAPRRALVRVFNPTLREHGYSSPHTVIEMVNDDMPFLVDSIGLALTRARAHAAFPGASDVRGGPRPRRRPAHASRSAAQRRARKQQRLESFQHIEVDRIVDPAALQSLCAEIERSMRDVRVACADWGKMRAAARQAARRFELAERALRSARRERNAGAARVDGEPAFHLSGLQGIPAARAQGPGRAASRSKPPASGILRTRPQAPAEHQPHPARATSAARAARAIWPWSPRRTCNPRCTAPGYLDYVGIKHFDAEGPADRRAALPGSVDLGRLQHQSARDSAGAPQSRASGRSTSRWRPTATTARRCSTFWNPFRATSCSRQACPNSSASSPASSVCRSGRACACCCGATRSAGSIPAWSSCRARNTTPRSANASSGSSARLSPRSAWNRRCRSPSRTSRASTSSRAPCRAKRRTSTTDALERRVARPCAPGRMTSRPPCWRASTRRMRCSCSRPMRRHFPPPTPRISRATPPRST